MAIAGDNVGRRRRALMSLGERARGPPEAKAGRGAFEPAKPEMWPLAFCQKCRGSVPNRSTSNTAIVSSPL